MTNWTNFGKRYLFFTCFSMLYSIFNGKSKKECLFLCYVVVGNNIAFVFDLT